MLPYNDIYDLNHNSKLGLMMFQMLLPDPRNQWYRTYTIGIIVHMIFSMNLELQSFIQIHYLKNYICNYYLKKSYKIFLIP